jgi:hypothetical protein
MEAQQQLFGLMAVAEEHQKAVKAAIDGLTAERAALAKERAAVAQAAASVAGVAAEVRKAAADAVPAMQKACRRGRRRFGEAIPCRSLRRRPQKRLERLQSPLFGSLSGVVQAAQAMPKARCATRAHGSLGSGWPWPLAGWSACAWWRMPRWRGSCTRSAACATKRPRLPPMWRRCRSNVSALEKKGGRIVMTTCGGRLCIEASSNQGAGAEQWKGGNWSNKETSVQLVIPRGY